jgi:ABC-type Mn2+/Zn2+ transport system permease subunit
VVFLGLAVASAATLGAALAQTVGWASDMLSLAAAIAAAVALGRVEGSNRMSAESLMGWAYAAATAATVLLLSWSPGGSADTLHLLFGNVLAVQPSAVVALTIIALLVVSMQLLFGRRFLLVTFDPEAATVAGVNTRLWSFLLNLTVGVAAAAAVQAIGALSTFALLTLPAAAALRSTSSVRATFAAAAVVSVLVPSVALAAAFYLDLPAGPACAALLAIVVPLAALTNGFEEGLWRRRQPTRRHASAAPADVV